MPMPGDPSAPSAATAGDGGRAVSVPRFGVVSAVHDYAGVRALHGVDFDISGGKVHGLVGENGSGKSTLVKVLTGVHEPTAGRMHVDGDVVNFSSPADAQRIGIGVVHQDYHLFPDLSVAANVYGVSKAPPRHRYTQTVDRRELDRRVTVLFKELGINLPTSVAVRDLGPAERKFVEIARAMLLKPRFLILDEPTASLEPQGSRNVLELLSRLRHQGVGLAFVSHRLDEILRVSDWVTVLRDGRLVASSSTQGMTEKRLAELIIGGKHEESRRRAQRVGRPTVFKVENLRVRPTAPPVSFEVLEGEIFGFTGLLGSGAAEIVHMLGGARPLSGRLTVNGKEMRVRTPSHARRAGIGFIPEDRKASGLVQEQSIAVNISLPSLGQVSTLGWIDNRRLYGIAESFKESLGIRTTSVRAPVSSLSGGNQQKVMLAKWLASGVRILAIEEPTHGIDIGGKAQVHELLRELAADGGSIVIASTDVHEVLTLCDRIAVMRHGELTRIMTADALTHAGLTAAGVQESEHLLEALVEADDGTQAV